MTSHDIIVIGTSAGGLAALQELVRELPRDLPAAILIVQHAAPLLPIIIFVKRPRTSAGPTCSGNFLTTIRNRVRSTKCRSSWT